MPCLKQKWRLSIPMGLNTKEIDPHTMESKKVKNLYFAGEVMDVIGKRGGYNFFFAYASAFIAAKAISEEC